MNADPKWLIGVKSAARFFAHLAAVIVAELATHPEVKKLSDLYDYKTALVIFIGVLTKFGTATAFATDVTVQK